MENFVIAGRAKEVFRLIELKAKYAERAKNDINNLMLDTIEKLGHQCQFDPKAQCKVPKAYPCAGIDCPVYKDSISGK